MKTLLPRLASPVGFGLALLFFLLPFVAVSCDVPGVGSAEISYTGVDLATGSTPSVDTSGEFNRDTGAPVPTRDDAPTPDVQVLALITMALLVVGLGVSLTPVLRTRTYGALGVLGAAVAAGALLITTEAVAQSNLKSALVDGARQASAATKPDDIPFNYNPAAGLFDDLIQSRIGFWLSLIAVLLVLLYNGGVLLWPRIRAATQQPAVAAGLPAVETPPLVEHEGEPPPPQ